jgi:hypothetical protein
MESSQNYGNEILMDLLKKKLEDFIETSVE